MTQIEVISSIYDFKNRKSGLVVVDSSSFLLLVQISLLFYKNIHTEFEMDQVGFVETGNFKHVKLLSWIFFVDTILNFISR